MSSKGGMRSCSLHVKAQRRVSGVFQRQIKVDFTTARKRKKEKSKTSRMARGTDCSVKLHAHLYCKTDPLNRTYL